MIIAWSGRPNWQLEYPLPHRCTYMLIDKYCLLVLGSVIILVSKCAENLLGHYENQIELRRVAEILQMVPQARHRNRMPQRGGRLQTNAR